MRILWRFRRSTEVEILGTAGVFYLGHARLSVRATRLARHYLGDRSQLRKYTNINTLYNHFVTLAVNPLSTRRRPDCARF